MCLNSFSYNLCSISVVGYLRVSLWVYIISLILQLSYIADILSASRYKKRLKTGYKDNITPEKSLGDSSQDEIVFKI